MDSSALFDLKNIYPRNTFKSLWESFELLCREQHIIFPREVLSEIRKGNDWLLEWSEEFEQNFLEPSDKEVEILNEVIAMYSEEVLQKYGSTVWADPFVLAAAKHFSLPIIQHESTDEKQFKIPSIAKKMGIKCIRLIDLFDDQSWQW